MPAGPEAAIGDRSSGPIFATPQATAAGITNADRISPHSMRHTYATTALDAGVPLRDVQVSMGHADPRTTRLYDRSRDNLDRNAAYAVAAVRSGAGTHLMPL